MVHTAGVAIKGRRKRGRVFDTGYLGKSARAVKESAWVRACTLAQAVVLSTALSVA